jgi:integrase
VINIDTTRRGRALSAGLLSKQQRSNGPARYVLSYTTAAGQRRRIALSTDARVAQQMRSQIIAQRDLEAAGLAPVSGMSMDLSELVAAYLVDLEARVGDSQYRNVKLRLTKILAALTARRVRDLRAVDVLGYRAARVKAGASHRTANCDVEALRAALRWAMQVGIIADSPLKSIKRLPYGEAHHVRRRRAMSDAELDAFLAASRDDDRRNEVVVARRSPRHDLPQRFRLVDGAHRVRVRQTPLWEFLALTGARYGEARQLAWGDVDLARGVALLRPENTKSQRARTLPITAEFAAELVELRAVHARALGRAVNEGDRVFLSAEARPLRRDTVNARRLFERLLRAAGIERIDSMGRSLDVHALRGTCATRLARRGVSISVTQKLLGHSSPLLTAKHYTKLEDGDVRAAVELGAMSGRRSEAGKREVGA